MFAWFACLGHLIGRWKRALKAHNQRRSGSEEEREAAGGKSEQERTSSSSPQKAPSSAQERSLYFKRPPKTQTVWSGNYERRDYGFNDGTNNIQYDPDETHRKFFPQHVMVYCDASADLKKKITGIGAFIGFYHPVQLSRDISYYINEAQERHDNTRAEIWAATVVLQRLLVWNGVWEENGEERKSEKHKAWPIVLRSDCQSMIEGLKKMKQYKKRQEPGPSTFFNDYQNLYTLATYFEKGILFQWIKNDDPRLGEADRFARRAIRKGIQEKDPAAKAYDNLRVHITYDDETKGHKPTDAYQPSPIVAFLEYEFDNLKESLLKDCKEDFPSAEQPGTSKAQPDTKQRHH
ncbi:unnamed protein product, partial [Mesorhabditis belari]|uniref:RNase H type-1 domain-containing protein n=1 Tax=Mesorhabditis belari TaxID=2138241 RepID=A0AAF3J306_9BILA